MPTVLFVCLPLEGHLRPVTNVAAAVQRLGVDVEFAALEPSRATVESMGVPFVSLGSAERKTSKMGFAERVGDTSTPPVPLDQFVDKAGANFAGWEEAVYPLLQAHMDRAGGRYAAIVSDQATMAAHDAAAVAGLPLVSLYQLPLSYSLVMGGHNEYNMPRSVPVELPCCVLPEAMTWLQYAFTNPALKRRGAAQITAAYGRHRAAARERLGLPPLPPSSGPFQPPPGIPRSITIVGGMMELETERPLPPGWHMSGPQVLPPVTAPPVLDGDKDAEVAAFLRAAQDAGEPVVYVALGSLVTPHEALVHAMAAAFQAAPGARFLWALRQASHAFLPPDLAPPAGAGGGKVLVVSWAAQTAVLAHPAVKLFVTHGGLGSLSEGLAAGKPLVALPFFADQHVNAHHLANRKLGTYVDASPAAVGSLARRLSKAIGELLGDAGTAQRAAQLGEKLRSCNGAEVAARRIAQFVGEAAGGGAAEVGDTSAE